MKIDRATLDSMHISVVEGNRDAIVCRALFRRLGTLILADDNDLTISAEIWRDCPGIATVRAEVGSCGVEKVHHFRLHVGDRVELATILKQLADRIEACLTLLNKPELQSPSAKNKECPRIPIGGNTCTRH